jgi:hypothetical protein
MVLSMRDFFIGGRFWNASMLRYTARKQAFCRKRTVSNFVKSSALFLNQGERWRQIFCCSGEGKFTKRLIAWELHPSWYPILIPISGVTWYRDCRKRFRISHTRYHDHRDEYRVEYQVSRYRDVPTLISGSISGSISGIPMSWSDGGPMTPISLSMSGTISGDSESWWPCLLVGICARLLVLGEHGNRVC